MKYEIKHEPFPVAICTLENNEEIMCQSGAMSWCSANMRMETTSNGGIGKMFGRAFSGESLFLNRYVSQGTGMIAFASSFPGKILPIEITPGQDFIVQKSGFLASYGKVDQSVFFQKRLGVTFFGGEGFIMQRLSGRGLAFIEIDGGCEVMTLGPGEKMILDTGYLAAMESTCSMDIVSVKGVKNVFFGGEGLFNTVVTGPGKIWVQTQPISSLAASLKAFFPNNGSSS